MTLADALEELRIKPPCSPEEVRRSYLRLLKTRNPEVDPLGFRRLREAYELAVRFSSSLAGKRPAPRPAWSQALPAAGGAGGGRLSAEGNLVIRLPYVWDYDIDEETFRNILAGRAALGRLDRDWAAVRLIEFAPYREIVRLLGFRDLLDGWPRWRDHIRSPGRRRGIDFLAWYLPERRPDLLVAR